MVRILLAIVIVVLMAYLAWTIIVRAYHVVHAGDDSPTAIYVGKGTSPLFRSKLDNIDPCVHGKV